MWSPEAGTCRCLLLWVFFLAIGSGDAALAALTVDTTLDGDDGECTLDCTLREAIGVAPAGEEILLPVGVYSLPLGEVQIDRDLTITGNGAAVTVVETSALNQHDRAFRIAAGAEVSISGLTMRLDVPGGFGGGIRNEGVLTLDDCALVGNGTLLLPGGGGLGNVGTATVNNCLVTGNQSEFGGAFGNEGVLTVNNTTISGNSSILAGAVVNLNGSTILNNTTVTANINTNDGPAGISFFSGTVTLRNSIVADQLSGADCDAPVDSSPGHNLDSDGTCVSGGGPGNITAPSLLAPLQDNGGPTETHAPMPGSPVIDGGNPATPGSGGDACLTGDQRGVTRPQGGACDIGAVELESDPGCADADGDDVCDVEDNCPSGFNPDQEPAAFGQAIVAESKDRFSWPVPADVVFVIGDLTAVDTLAVLESGTLLDETSIFDPVVPSPGFGAFYLVRLGGDCSVASWQTTVGVEPERDVFLP